MVNRAFVRIKRGACPPCFCHCVRKDSQPRTDIKDRMRLTTIIEEAAREIKYPSYTSGIIRFFGMQGDDPFEGGPDSVQVLVIGIYVRPRIECHRIKQLS